MTDNTGLQFSATVGSLAAQLFPMVDFTQQEALSLSFPCDLNPVSAHTASVLNNSSSLKICYNGQLQHRVFGMVSEHYFSNDSAFWRQN